MSRVASWLLNGLYLALVVVASPWLVWSAMRHGKYRNGWRAKWLGEAPLRQGTTYCIWLHAVSVGEVNLLATLISEISRRHPDWEVVISTATKTGYDLAQRKYSEQHTVFYAPLDFSWAVRRAVRRIRPNMLVLAELELWPNLIAAAKQSEAKVAIVNGRLSDKSFRGYRRGRWLVAKVLGRLDAIVAQDEVTAERFAQLGARSESLFVSGSLKYDGAQTDRENPRTVALRRLANLPEDAIVLVAGSTQAPEEEMALGIFKRLAPDHPRLHLVIVPRHPERFDEVAALLARSGVAWRRRSQLIEGGENPTGAKVLLVDTIGELGAWWGTARVGFVGGSFGDRGGQNMIEPAAYGVATCFGPNTWNFRDIVQALLKAEGAIVVENEEQLFEFVTRAVSDSGYAAELGGRARAFVATQLGATGRTVKVLEDLMPGANGCRQRAA